jgi:hypothetical protein
MKDMWIALAQLARVDDPTQREIRVSCDGEIGG